MTTVHSEPLAAQYEPRDDGVNNQRERIPWLPWPFQMGGKLGRMRAFVLRQANLNRMRTLDRKRMTEQAVVRGPPAHALLTELAQRRMTM